MTASTVKHDLTEDYSQDAEGAKMSAKKIVNQSQIRERTTQATEVIAADAYLTFIAITHQVYIRQYTFLLFFCFRHTPDPSTTYPILGSITVLLTK